MVRCKFRCKEISKREGFGEHKVVYAAKFQAVYGQDAGSENAQFFAATPSGAIEVSTVREDHFEVGAEYYVEAARPARPSAGTVSTRMDAPRGRRRGPVMFTPPSVSPL